jgi:5-methylcytosine-specific restriction protein A
MEPFVSPVSEEEIRKERSKARELRKTQWWKRKCSTGVCHYCGKNVNPKDLTMDHRIPVVRGGKSTKGNVVPVCKECNDKKKYMLPVEWEEYLELLGRTEED